MIDHIINHIKTHARQPLTNQLLVSLLKPFERPDEKIDELVKAQLIVPMKEGLYVADKKLNAGRPEPFLVANHIFGPSYVSLETALAYYGFIPERVYEIASITTQSSCKFETPIGRFTYTHFSTPYYTFGIKCVMLAEDQYAMVASPEKALCDKVVDTLGLSLRSKKSAIEFLVENLRIEEDKLKELNLNEMSMWLEYAPKAKSLEMIIGAIRNLE